ncbi:hypothetical protein HaLaN_29209 [Haematococcus lacustris]|uniref:Uncharacterized protein n=1 Tax=Haematococcus lacustris TaxID=44745 RepID=A0A6A0AET0_HAELA|nr:hypothetical protein HaLaN_29209 [Haematococcus lacustris]
MVFGKPIGPLAPRTDFSLSSSKAARCGFAKQNLAAKQKSSAAVQVFKAALTTGRDRAAAKRKEQMEDPATVTPFAAVFDLLKLGRPMTDIEQTPYLLRVARTPAIAAKH